MDITFESIIEAQRIVYAVAKNAYCVLNECIENIRRMNAAQRKRLIECMKEHGDVSPEVEQAIWRL